jgi:hypothetical protein
LKKTPAVFNERDLSGRGVLRNRRVQELWMKRCRWGRWRCRFRRAPGQRECNRAREGLGHELAMANTDYRDGERPAIATNEPCALSHGGLRPVFAQASDARARVTDAGRRLR